MTEPDYQKKYQELLITFQSVRTERDMLRKVLRVARINKVGGSSHQPQPSKKRTNKYFATSRRDSDSAAP